MVGGHIHTSDIRMPKSANHTNLKLPLLMAPSLTGYYMNNPGYTMLEFTASTNANTLSTEIKRIECTFRFFQLEDYIFFGKERYLTINIREKFGLDLLKPDGITQFIQKLKGNEHEYATYTLLRMGYKEHDLDKVVSTDRFPMMKEFLAVYYRQEYTKVMSQYFYDTNPEECLPKRK
jgi:hypothetical protein